MKMEKGNQCRVHIYRSPKTPVMSAPGIWIDCGGQGVRITGNVIYDLSNDFAIYLELDHGTLGTEMSEFTQRE